MKLSFRKAILIYTLVPIIVLFSVFAINNMYMIKREAIKRVENHMTDLAISYASIVDGFLRPIEGAAIINANLVEETDVLSEKNIYKLLGLQVENNPIIYGAAIAFMPNQFSSEKRLFAPYVYRKNGKLTRIDIAESGYDYTDGKREWWSQAVATGKAVWSEPYFDEGAGNILMSTYSVPFYKENKLWGVATADIALNKISDQIHIPGIKGQEILVLSSTGKVILHWDKNAIGKSIYNVIKEKFQAVLMLAGNDQKDKLNETKTKLDYLVDKMIAGKAGVVNLNYLGVDSGFWSFYAPIESVGWSFSIRVKESEIFRVVYDQFLLSIIFFCLLLVLTIISVVLVSGKFSRSLEGLITRCQRIERLNFQLAQDESENIDEILQLSRTLNNMCLVLDSHYSIKEDERIAEAIRHHVLPLVDMKLEGYQIESWSNAGQDNCGEVFDIMNCSLAHSAVKQGQLDLAFFLLDDADNGIDAAVKNGQLRAIFRTMVKQGRSLAEIAEQMNDYLINDLNLNGPVQMSIGTLSHHDATLSVLNLGQNGVLHFSTAGAYQYKGYSQALATQKHLPGLQTTNFTLQTGAFFVLCSDGVLGAQNKQREQFSIQSIEQLIKRHPEQSAHNLIRSIQAEITDFTESAYLQTERSVIVIKRS